MKLDFIPVEAFSGAMPGYVFKMGPSGLGYYKDATAEAPEGSTVDETMAEAPPQEIEPPAEAASSGGPVAGPQQKKRKNSDTELLEHREKANLDCMLAELHVLRYALALSDLSDQQERIEPLKRDRESTEKSFATQRAQINQRARQQRAAALERAKARQAAHGADAVFAAKRDREIADVRNRIGALTARHAHLRNACATRRDRDRKEKHVF